ncbi:hypothetical protein GC173_10190 [bacterium]|nr:hypothetical protein [bacterium]
MDNPLPHYPPPGSRSGGVYAGIGGKLTTGEVITRSDVPFSWAAWIGWTVASRSVWPADALQTPVFALYLGRLRGAGGETLVALLPWMTFAALALAAREATFPGPTPPTFWKEYGFWFSVGLVQAMIAPVVGIGQVALLGRAFARHLPLAVREELSLCPNIKARDLVYGIGARLAAANGLGVVIWLTIILGASHWYLTASIGQAPVNGLAMVVLITLLLYGAYTTRVFSDHAVAVAARAWFLLPERADASARAIRDYFLWRPVVFILAPVAAAFLLLLIGFMEAWLLAFLVIIVFPVAMGSLAAATEQRAARVMARTVGTLDKIGLNGGEHRSFKPPKLSESWPE